MNYLPGFSDLLLFQSSTCCNISPLWHLQSCIFRDRSLSLSLYDSIFWQVFISISPSVYLLTHCLTLSFVHLLFSPIFYHQPLLSITSTPPLLYISSFHLNHHSTSSCTIICFPLILSCRELRCVFVFVSCCVTDWFALCWFWWRRCCCFRDGGTGKVKGSTSAEVNWQHVDQTGLNQNHSPLSAAQRTQFSRRHDTLSSPFNSAVNLDTVV